MRGTTPSRRETPRAEDPGGDHEVDSEVERLFTVEEEPTPTPAEEFGETVEATRGTMSTSSGTLKPTSNGLRTMPYPYPYPAGGGPSLPPSTTQSVPVSRRSSMVPMSRQQSVVEPSQTPAEVPHQEGLSGVDQPAPSGEGVPDATTGGLTSSSTPTGGAADRSRSMSRSTTQVRRALSEGAASGREKRRALEPLVLDAKTVEVLLAEDSQHHPLVKAVNQAREDIANGDLNLGDHGTWDGRWSWPGRYYRYMAMQEHGYMLPPKIEVVENEANMASAHKEIQWSSLSQARKDNYQMAANDQCSKWLEISRKKRWSR